MNPFTWLRRWARNAILAGVSDAAAVLSEGVEDPGTAALALFPRLAGPLAGPDGEGRPAGLPAPADGPGAAPAQADATPARRARKEARP